MVDWNVVVTTQKDGYQRAMHLLGKYGVVNETDFYNVLTMWAEDIPRMMEEMRLKAAADVDLLKSVLARVAPVTHIFHFSSPVEFEDKAKEIVLAWAPQLAGKTFHVRMHRRGFRKRLSSMEEERRLDDILLNALMEMGSPGHIAFDDADAIIMVETIGNQAGFALWRREDLARYPFLHLD